MINNSSFLLRIIFCFSFISLINSCGTIKPDSPQVIVQQLYIPEQTKSTVKIPIKVNLKPYFKETDRSIPWKFDGKEQTCEGISYEYKFYRSSIKFEGNGSQLLFDVNGKYSLKLNYCPQCTGLFDVNGSCVIPRIYSSCGIDEPLRKIEVGYATKINLTNQYKLNSTTKLRKVKTLNPCLVSAFNYDATKTLKEEITTALQDLEKDIDEDISAVDLRPEMEETWDLLSEAMDLEGYGFLYMNPSSVSVSKISFKGDTAYFNTIIEATPTILSNKEKQQKYPLPDLTDYKNRDGFDITMDVFTTYDSLSSIITQNIKGTSLEIKGKEIIFDDVTIHGASNNGIHLKVEFKGDKKGTMYFTGSPKFDATTQKIAFPDLTFDVKTKHALLKSAKWLFNKKITQAIREAAEVELTPYLDAFKGTINESLNSELAKDVFMKGNVEKITIDLIHPLTDQLFIRINSIGKLEISM